MTNEYVAAAQNLLAPRISQPWIGQGGSLAGTMPGRDGGLDYHLIVADAEHGELSGIQWGGYGKKIVGADSYFDGRANTAAMVDAGLDLGNAIRELTIDGHSDWYLPSQAEIHLIAATMKDQFDQNDLYWTSTQYSALSAWYQYFRDGFQDYSFKGYEGRARAVRRLLINP